jgi:hypothetical protein
MSSISEVVYKYIFDVHAPQQSPEYRSAKFNIATNLISTKDIFNLYFEKRFVTILYHFLTNSQSAILGHDNKIDKKYLGLEPQGTITYRSFSENDIEVLEVEDDGSGVDLAKLELVISQDLEKLWYMGVKDETWAQYSSAYELMQKVFLPAISTRKLDGRVHSGMGGVGLMLAQAAVDEFSQEFGYARLFVKGTTYEVDGQKVTVGEHHARHTGTIMRVELGHKY